MGRDGREPATALGRYRRWTGLSALMLVACSAAGERNADPDELDPDELHSGVDGDARLLGFPLDAADAEQAPLLLSQTGAFAQVATLSASESFVPYRVQSPLFSDGAQKQRWFSLPPEGHIGFSRDAAWTFPATAVKKSSR
jgi:hypothetical protein